MTIQKSSRISRFRSNSLTHEKAEFLDADTVQVFVDGHCSCLHVKTPTLSDLPADILLQIISFFDGVGKERLLGLPVSRSWFTASTFNNNTWRFLCQHSWNIKTTDMTVASWRTMHHAISRAFRQVENAQVEDTLHILSHHIDVPVLQEKAIGRVATLCLASDEQRSAMVEKGAIPVVVDSFRRHAEVEGLCAVASRSLVFLGRPCGGKEGTAFVGEERSLENLRAMSNLDVIPLLLGSMRRFPNSVDVQASACWTLTNLALLADSKSAISTHGGLDLVLDALTRFPVTYDVQHRGIFALINLAILEESKLMLVRQGAVQLVLKAMNHFADSLELHQRALCALRNMCLHPHTIAEMRRLPVKDQLRKTYSSFINNEKIVEGCLKLLARLEASPVTFL